MPNISPQPWDAMQRAFTVEIDRLAQLVFERYCRNCWESLYLVGTRRAGLDTLNPTIAIWERLSVASEAETDARPELTCIRPEPLPRNVTLEHLRSIIRDWLRSEPLAIFAD